MMGLDFAAVVIGLIAFFTHVLNRFKKVIQISRDVLKTLMDQNDFYNNIKFLAEHHRTKLAQRHGAGSRHVTILDGCIRSCKNTFGDLEENLWKIQSSHLPPPRAYLEKDAVKRCVTAINSSVSELNTIMSMSRLVRYL
jgi:hypothetical protein